MANRYLIKSGNWSDTSIWSISDGGSGGASVPGVSDTAFVVRAYTVTLTADVSCVEVVQTKGRVNLNGKKLTSKYEMATSLSTLDMSNSTFETTSLYIYSNVPIGNIITTQSELIFRKNTSGTHFFKTNSAAFADCKVILTDNTTSLSIEGSPSFRTLDIRSADSAAHTVIADDLSIITADKLIVMGYSTSKRLTLSSVGDVGLIIKGSAYGQFLNITGWIDNYYGGGTSSTPLYAGANSIQSSGYGWLLQNPPAASTLVDTFSTLDTGVWNVFTYRSGFVNVSGGKLHAGWGGISDSFYSLTTKDTYDLTNDSIYVKVDSLDNNMFIGVEPAYTPGEFYGTISGMMTPTVATEYYRIKSTVSGSNANVVIERGDGASWTTITTKTIDAEQVRSLRLTMNGSRNMSSAELIIDSIGIGPGPQADFTSNTGSGVRPLTVSFSDQSTLITPTSWAWAFGDGGTSTTKNPNHTYTKAGTYDVSLTVSDGATSKSVIKTAFITALPMVFSREITGSLLFGGSVLRPAVIKTREISGSLLFGGSVIRPVKTTYPEITGSLMFGGELKPIIIKDTQALPGKSFLYKVYDEDGTFITIWKNDGISDPAFTHEINTIGSSMDIELAKTSDSLGTSTGPLQTEAGTTITTESMQTIQVVTESRNQIGPGSSIQYNNRVDIYAYYGEVTPLLTEAAEVLLTEDDELILASLGAPNGIRIFTGFISDINTRYGNTDTVQLQLTSFGWDLNQYPITNALGETTVKFLSKDPSDIAREAVDKFVADSATYNTYTKRTADSVSTTGTVVSYTFKANTYADVLDKTLELMPSNWYYYVDLGNNTVYFRQRSVNPKHLFYLGKHIKALDLRGSTLAVKNRVLFTGGGDPALFKERVQAPAPRTRRALEIYSDSRVTIPTSAEIISDGIIDERNKIQYRTTVEIMTKVYDIESIKVGDEVGFRNFGNFVDSLTMQVVGLSYTPDVVQLQLDSKSPTINSRLEDIYRNLKVTENQAVPDAPS